MELAIGLKLDKEFKVMEWKELDLVPSKRYIKNFQCCRRCR